MSDTPRTDEQINGKPCTRFDILAGDSLRNASVPSEFARELERELNEIERLAAVRLSYIKLIEAQNDAANDRIKRLEEELERTKQDRNAIAKNTREPLLLKLDHANDRIKRLEDRIRRASIAFFEDGSDASVASGMLAILEEERNKP